MLINNEIKLSEEKFYSFVSTNFYYMEDAEKTTPKDKVEKKNTKDIKKKSAAPIEDQPVAKTAKKDKVAVKPAEDKKSKPAKKD